MVCPSRCVRRADRVQHDHSAAIPCAERERAALAGRVYAALDADPMCFHRHMDVSTDSDVVSLSSYVWGPDAIFQARRIAARVPTGICLFNAAPPTRL